LSAAASKGFAKSGILKMRATLEQNVKRTNRLRFPMYPAEFLLSSSLRPSQRQKRLTHQYLRVG
jgi:hypothetical protein